MITPSTILILSGWLLAMSMGRMLPCGSDVYSLLAGLGGVTAYTALELVAKRRRSLVVRRRSDEAVHKLERELEEIERLNKSPVPRRSASASDPAGIREFKPLNAFEDSQAAVPQA